MRNWGENELLMVSLVIVAIFYVLDNIESLSGSEFHISKEYPFTVLWSTLFLKTTVLHDYSLSQTSAIFGRLAVATCKRSSRLALLTVCTPHGGTRRIT